MVLLLRMIRRLRIEVVIRPKRIHKRFGAETDRGDLEFKCVADYDFATGKDDGCHKRIDDST